MTRIVSSSLAPVLSATLTRDSCWIIGLLRLLEDLDEAPALRRGQRTGLADQHEVADTGGAGLVVDLDLAGTADDLAVQRVLHAVLDLDDDGLLHLVADDVAAAGLAVPPGGLVADVARTVLVACGRSGALLRLRHYFVSSDSAAASGAASVVVASSAFLARARFGLASATGAGAGVALMP